MDNCNKLVDEITKQYKIIGGNWDSEKIEQQFCAKYIKPDNNILELGSNIGRVSIVMSHILKNGAGKLVTLETNFKIFKTLINNKKNNNLDFMAINKALSKRDISQVMNGNCWRSYPTNDMSKSEIFTHLRNQVASVDKISLKELKNETNVEFDTLVIDCEGAFYFILKDFPEILDGIKLIIIENDCPHEYQNTFILNTIKKNGFNVVESRTLPIAWGGCKEYFWQVYRRD
jgi:FkbM family methyltransferase